MPNLAQLLTLVFSRRLQWTASMLLLSCAVAMLNVVPAQAQTYTVIHDLTGGPGGAHPYAGVVVDHAGNLYGTTAAGGGGSCSNFLGTGCGIAFELNPFNGLFTRLWQFTGVPDGAGPTTVLLGPGNALYVSTAGGGNISADCGVNYLQIPGCGTIVSLSPPAAPPRSIQDNHWIETILHKFQGDPDGDSPTGNLAMDQAGNLYGATYIGGSEGQGTVFELAHSNGSWSESVLHSFLGNGEVAYPTGGVTFDAAGNLYGTANGGGGFDFGAVFQLVAASDWRENTLFSFNGGADGLQPNSGVTFDSSGNLYGSTPGAECGSAGGTVFELSNGSWAYSTIYCFMQGGFGGGPNQSTLVFDQAGNLYGTTFADGANGWGSVFKLTPSNGIWTYTSLHDFTGGSDGGYPVGNLVFDANGNLYGTASCGGSTGTCGHQNSGYGVIFKISGL